MHPGQWFFAFLCVVLASCTFSREIQEKEEISCAFAHLVLAHEYEEALQLFNEEALASMSDPGALQIALSKMEDVLDGRIGRLRDCNVAWAEKRSIVQTDAAGNRRSRLIENFVLELVGADSLAWLAITFAEDGKLISVNLLDERAPVPEPGQAFPYYGIIGLGILLVGLMGYTIYRIVRSQWRYKWLWVLFVLLGNVTQVGYRVLDGWFFDGNLLSFNILPMGFLSGSYNGMVAWLSFPLGLMVAWSKWLLDSKKEGRPQG